MTSIAGLLAANVLFGLLGAGALMLTGTWDRLPPLSRIGPSVLAGIAGAATLLPPLIYLGIAPTALVGGTLAVAVLALGLAVRRRRTRVPLDVSGGGLLTAGIVALLLAPLTLRAATEPLVKFDAYADWSLKAKLLYGHGGLVLGALDPHAIGSYYQAAHREYPLGLPAVEALDFHLTGGVDSRVIHLQIVVLLLAFLATAWALLRPRVHPAILGSVLCLLVVAPSLHSQVLSAYADIPFACLWGLAALSLGLWIAGDGADRLGLATLFAAAALATKQEGIVLDAALFVVAGVAVGLSRNRGQLRAIALAAGAVVLSGLPWQLHVRSLDLHDRDIAPSASRMAHQVHSLPAIAHSLVGELVWTRWPGVVPLVVGVAVWLAWSRRDAVALGILALLATTTFGLAVVYWNAAVPVHPLLVESARRVVTAPILLAVLALPLLLERLLQVAPAAVPVPGVALVTPQDPSAGPRGAPGGA